MLKRGCWNYSNVLFFFLAGVGASGDVDDMMFSMEEVTEGSGTSGGVKGEIFEYSYHFYS